MKIFISGVNFKTTPLEIREKLSFSIEEQKHTLKEIHKLSCVSECAMLSTCNRTEVYIYSDDNDFDYSMIENLLCEIKGLSIYDLKKYFYVYKGLKAVKHLFKVASGLDSLVLGEDQILGQVKGAYEMSLETETSSSVLNTLFREVITAAKKVKTDTNLSRNSVSIGSLAVNLLMDIFGGQLEDKCALIIGAGKMGSIALKNLSPRGIGKTYVTSRTHGKADDLSKIYRNATAVDYNSRYSVIDECDIVISSTASPHYTITRDVMEKTIINKKKRVFIDLAVPRDIDIAVKELPDVEYYSIDDLQLIAGENIDKRLVEAKRAEQIIDQFAAGYEKWFRLRGVLPVVREVQRFADGMLNEKISDTMVKLKCASEEDKEVIKASIAGTVNGILNKLVYSVRDNGSKEDIEVFFRCLGSAIKNGQE